jgi:hypothetical protein
LKKIFLISVLLQTYLLIYSQSLQTGIDFPLSKSDLVKHKISKITITTTESPDYVMDYYLDNNGNDTALYIKGKLLSVIKYNRNKYGRVIERISYDSNRLEETKGTYSYKSNGSYSIKLSYKKYGSISQTEEYNHEGKIQSEFLMDGGQHIFKYDSIGRLTKIEYMPGLDGYDNYVAEYTYQDSALLQHKKVIHRRMPGPYEYSEEYFYDSKGLLVKSEKTVTHSYDNEKEFYTKAYSYTFRK